MDGGQGRRERFWLEMTGGEHAPRLALKRLFVGSGESRYRLSTWLLVYVLYGAAFLLLREIGQIWQGEFLVSFWFPAAGLRFAFLWRFGPGHAPIVACIELATHSTIGQLTWFASDPWLAVALVMPPLAYGAVIYGVRVACHGRAPVRGIDPMTVSIAAVVAPFAAAAPVILLLHISSDSAVDLSSAALLRVGLTFATGDLLGVVLIATPILWLAESNGHRFRSIWSAASRKHWWETLITLCAGWSVTLLFLVSGVGIRLTPVLLAVALVGFRSGRIAAWTATFVSAAIVLVLTAGLPGDATTFVAHITLAVTAFVGHLIGGYSDSERRLKAELDRRNKLLFRAERLKTLRAMSLSVIHEISQPLSTLRMETARHVDLVEKSARDPESLKSAQSIAKAAEHLSQIVTSLRSFGESSGSRDQLVSAADLVRRTAEMVGNEAQGRRKSILLDVQEGLFCTGDPVELQQCLLNLVRNAIRYSTGHELRIYSAQRDDEPLKIGIESDGLLPADRGGLGIGITVSRTIAEAHGGALHHRVMGERMIFEILLPAVRQ